MRWFKDGTSLPSAIPNVACRGGGCCDRQRLDRSSQVHIQRWPSGSLSINAWALLINWYLYTFMKGRGAMNRVTHRGYMISRSYSSPSNSPCLWSLWWWGRRECFFKSQLLYIDRERERGGGKRERLGLSMVRCNVWSLGAVVTCVRKREGGRLTTGLYS